MSPDSAAAFALEQQVLAAREIERMSWVPLAEHLSAFHTARAWEALGWERFDDWLAMPEIGIGRRSAYRLIQCWNWAEMVGVPPEALARVDATKLVVVIASVNRGEAGVEEALSDVESLSRSDLIAKYIEHGEGPEKAGEPQTEQCPACGLQRIPAEFQEAAA